MDEQRLTQGIRVLGLGAAWALALTACTAGAPGRVPGAGPMGPGTPSYSIAQAPGPASAPQAAAAPAPSAPAATPALAPPPLAPPPVVSAPVAPPPAPRPTAAAARAPTDDTFTFTFAVGDELEVSVWNEKELTTTHRVLRDGTIPAKAVGNVRVVGRTIDAVHAELTDKYAEFLNDPRVSIRVVSIWKDRVFVVGEVAKPAAIAMPAQMSVWEAITQAGGFNAGVANMRTVRIIRQTDAGRPRIITVNAESVISGRARMTPLQPGDLVYVHPTDLADWSRRLNQLLSPIGAIVGNAANVITAAAVID